MKRLYQNGDSKGVSAQHADKIELILSTLDAAHSIEAMRLPSFRLHQLTGNRKAFWAVTVRANWRIIFRFEAGQALDLDLVDYH